MTHLIQAATALLSLATILTAGGAQQPPGQQPESALDERTSPEFEALVESAKALFEALPEDDRTGFRLIGAAAEAATDCDNDWSSPLADAAELRRFRTIVSELQHPCPPPQPTLDLWTPMAIEGAPRILLFHDLAALGTRPDGISTSTLDGSLDLFRFVISTREQAAAALTVALSNAAAVAVARAQSNDCLDDDLRRHIISTWSPDHIDPYTTQLLESASTILDDEAIESITDARHAATRIHGAMRTLRALDALLRLQTLAKQQLLLAAAREYIAAAHEGEVGEGEWTRNIGDSPDAHVRAVTTDGELTELHLLLNTDPTDSSFAPREIPVEEFASHQYFPDEPMTIRMWPFR